MSMKEAMIGLIGMSMVVGMYGCSKELSSSTVLGRAGAARVTVEDLGEPLMAGTDPLYTSAMGTPQGRRKLVEALLGDKIMLEEAKKAKVMQQAEVQDAIKAYREQAKKAETQFINTLVMQKYREELGRHELGIEAFEMRKYYDDHKGYFDAPVRMLASQILCAKEGDAEKALGRLEQGEDFEKVAEEVSRDPNAQRGMKGIIGEVGLGDLPAFPEIEKELFGLPIRGYSGILRTKLGYQIVKKNGAVTLPAESYEEARPMIQRILEEEKLQQWIDKKKQDTKIWMNDKALSSIEITVGDAKPPKK